MKNALDFSRDFEQSPEMQIEFQKVISEGGYTDEADALDALVEFAKSKGYDFEAEDFTMARASGREISDEELSVISGGTQPYCLWDYSCYYAFKHDQDGPDACTTDYSCFDDFICLVSSNQNCSAHYYNCIGNWYENKH